MLEIQATARGGGMTSPAFSRIGIIVLAAGQATRMGRLKQLLPLGDRSLAQRVIDAALAATAGPVVAVLHPAVAAAGIPRPPHPCLHPVVNPWPEQGQARSLRLGLRCLLQVEPALAAAMIVLADQPFITPRALAGLAGAFDRAVKQAAAGSTSPATFWPSRAPVAARPVWQGRPGHPVVLGRPLFAEVLTLAGDEGARPLLQRYRDRVLGWPAPGPEVTLDVDTWEDYLAACRLLEKEEQP
ncbi:putative MobA-like protein [Thermaerobacter subterraneus DSM 13965]|uniref:MobA-like protein n=1 Tax=Thermaerobacter subterraneus DSM 13965 TaxID=867903 RepID=K6PRK1_9FIRM|nr:putative MobA-like protein [Thermaerobacter subterraneus DSM 13965]